jgi:hypothetical protein
MKQQREFIDYLMDIHEMIGKIDDFLIQEINKE